MFERAAFFAAAHRIEDFPPDSGAEIAFAGRSNAGKSSAINVLVNRKRLAFFSRSPGRTQAVSFFSLGGRRFLVDLPGYGYAAASKRARHSWGNLVSAYLQERKSLRGLILVMDIRNALTDLDCRLLEWATILEAPVHVLLAKADKLSRSQATTALRSVETMLSRDFPRCTVQLFSGTTGVGAEQARSIAAAWLK